MSGLICTTPDPMTMNAPAPVTRSPSSAPSSRYTEGMSQFLTASDSAERAAQFIFDWNEVNRKGRLTPRNVTFFDETLRDGLQNPSVVDPSIESKLEILHLMEDLGIHEADIGLPGSSKRAFDDVLR